MVSFEDSPAFFSYEGLIDSSPAPYLGEGVMSYLVFIKYFFTLHNIIDPHLISILFNEYHIFADEGYDYWLSDPLPRQSSRFDALFRVSLHLHVCASNW